MPTGRATAVVAGGCYLRGWEVAVWGGAVRGAGLTVRTAEAASARARHLLTPAVVAHVREHELSFVLLGKWLSVTVPLVTDAEALVPLIDASTELAALLPTHPPGRSISDLGTQVLDWLWPDRGA